ncbi:MAG TPA: FecR domain-containing protein [Puia sp.]|nr:FecR domain-containing protein [Puia sp.]
MNNEGPYLSGDEVEKARRVAYLINGYTSQTLSVAEHDELDAWVEESDDNMRLFEELTDEKNIDALKKWMAKLDSHKALEKFRARALSMEKKRAPILSILVTVAAASIIGLGIILLMRNNRGKEGIHQDIAGLSGSDIPPGSNRAALTLDDGSTIILDSLHDGKIAVQGTAVVNKDGAAIHYSPANAVSNLPASFNKLTTPRGGQYHIVLADGTRVWLNAASSIRYPAQFSGGERKVEVTGEAYFEVAKDPVMPFRVVAGNAKVEVVGTHFNVNAYGDEDVVATTLLEGSVKFSSGGKEILLKPGQRGKLLKTGELALDDQVDTGEAIAWKNGEFAFHDEPIASLMRQASRWYDFDIRYEGEVSDHFNADISRDVPVSKLLHLLELTGRVHFEVDGKTIIVKP